MSTGMAAETKVQTEIGMLSLDTLYTKYTNGDSMPRVYSLDTTTGATVLKQIINVSIATNTNTMLDVLTISGNVVRCTTDHLFLLTNGNYVAASTLKQNDRIRSSTDQPSFYTVEEVVSAVTPAVLSGNIPFYNMTLESPNNLAVGSNFVYGTSWALIVKGI